MGVAQRPQTARGEKVMSISAFGGRRGWGRRLVHALALVSVACFGSSCMPGRGGTREPQHVNIMYRCDKCTMVYTSPHECCGEPARRVEVEDGEGPRNGKGPNDDEPITRKEFVDGISALGSKIDSVLLRLRKVEERLDKLEESVNKIQEKIKDK